MSTVFGNNPRFRIPTAEAVESINYDRVLEIGKTLYGNAANFNFVFVGNFDEAVLRGYIEQYIASLPSKGKADLKAGEIRTFVKGEKKNNFEKQMENPQAQAAEFWRSNAMPYTLRNIVLNDMASRVLDMKFNREIRERLSAAYHNEVLTCLPDKVADAIPEFKKGMDATVASPDLDDLNKVKQILLKQADVDAKTNRYWITVIQRLNRFGVDIHTDYKKTIESVDAKAVSNYLKNNILNSGNHIEVLMMPKK